MVILSQDKNLKVSQNSFFSILVGNEVVLNRSTIEQLLNYTISHATGKLVQSSFLYLGLTQEMAIEIFHDEKARMALQNFLMNIEGIAQKISEPYLTVSEALNYLGMDMQQAINFFASVKDSEDFEVFYTLLDVSQMLSEQLPSSTLFASLEYLGLQLESAMMLFRTKLDVNALQTIWTLTKFIQKETRQPDLKILDALKYLGIELCQAIKIFRIPVNEQVLYTLACLPKSSFNQALTLSEALFTLGLSIEQALQIFCTKKDLKMLKMFLKVAQDKMEVSGSDSDLSYGLKQKLGIY